MSRIPPVSKTWYACLWVLLAGALFLAPAFYNGYPIVNSDDGTYIGSGFNGEFPDDRPISYGVLLRILSLNGVTLWGIIVFQALTAAVLLWRCCSWMPARYRAACYAGLCLFLAGATSLSSILSQMLPDAFCPILILAVVVLAGTPNRPWPWGLYGLIFLSVAVHISHLMLLVPVLLLGSIAARGIAGKAAAGAVRRRMVAALAVSLLALPLLLIPVRRSGPAFTVAALIDEGILVPWLRDHCPTERYRLCASLDSMPPNSIMFLWDGNSPFSKDGGFKGTHDDYQRLVRRMHQDPAVLRARLWEGGTNGLKQVLYFDMGDGMSSFPRGTFLYDAIEKHLPGEAAVYNDSRQSRAMVNATQKLEGINRIWRWVVGSCAAIWLLTLFPLWHRMQPLLRWPQLLLPAFAVSNAVACGMFSVVIHRYGARAMWVFPLLAGLNLAHAFWSRLERKAGVPRA